MTFAIVDVMYTPSSRGEYFRVSKSLWVKLIPGDAGTSGHCLVYTCQKQAASRLLCLGECIHYIKLLYNILFIFTALHDG